MKTAKFKVGSTVLFQNVAKNKKSRGTILQTWNGSDPSYAVKLEGDVAVLTVFESQILGKIVKKAA